MVWSTFHVCLFDKGGGGLKLFGQCPYRTNIFQKGLSKLNESFDTTLGPICACLSPWWISVIPLSTLTTDVSISLMRPRHRTNIAAHCWPDLFQTTCPQFSRKLFRKIFWPTKRGRFHFCHLLRQALSNADITDHMVATKSNLICQVLQIQQIHASWDLRKPWSSQA